MKAIDTNVLVRFLVQDDEAQSAIVNKLFTEAETNKHPLFVSTLVLLEMMWVLQSVYSVARQDILLSIDELLSMSALAFQEQAMVRGFLAQAKNNTFDLSDLLIGQSAMHSGCDMTLTFDKKAAKSSYFKKL